MRESGGRGRIRTSVARKERQIYSLLVLATHPPVPHGETKTQKRLVCKDTRPSDFQFREPVRASIPNFPTAQSQLAEGFEPPAL